LLGAFENRSSAGFVRGIRDGLNPKETNRICSKEDGYRTLNSWSQKFDFGKNKKKRLWQALHQNG